MESFDRQYFSQFNVVTAEDLLKRIPGVQDILTPPATSSSGAAVNSQQQEVRGFGSSGAPILFNGRRFSGKSNDAIAVLQRIQAPRVVRVDVISGSVPGLDIRVGEAGKVVNIILDETLTDGYGAWDFGLTYYDSGRWAAGGSLSYAGTLGALSYDLSAKISPRFSGRDTHDIYVLPPNNAEFGGLFLTNTTAGTDYTVTAALSYQTAWGDVLNLNSRYATEDRVTTQPVENYALLNGGNRSYNGSSRLIQDYAGDLEWEIGGDYEHNFGNGDNWRALFVLSSDHRPSIARLFTQAPSEAEFQNFSQTVSSLRTERIVRSYYNATLMAGRSIEIGAEVALNALNQANRRKEQISGVLTPVPLFNSDAKVSETRLESFSRYAWQVSSSIFLEGAFDTELSRLRQNGSDVSTSRRFFFAKPRLDVRYDLNPTTQIRGRIFRTISQLDFSNFVSSVSTSDVRIGVIQAGNPNLAPEKTWTMETTIQRRLPAGLQGNVSVRGFYNDIADVIDKVEIAPNVAGVGNIGAGRSYGVELKIASGLGRFGLPNASIDGRITFQDSTVTDAFTGRSRPLQSFQNYLWSMTFRHDTNWRSFAYGATVTGSDARFGSDIDYIEDFLFKPTADLWAEMPFAGMTLRIESKQALQVVTRDRLLFRGNRIQNDIRRRELRHDTFVTSVALVLKGTF